MATKAVTSKKPQIFNVMLEDGKKVGLILLGFIGGNIVGRLLDKAIGATGAGFSLKNLGRPVLLIGGGLLGAAKIKNQDLRFLCYGVAGAGGYSGIKLFLNKDILNGFAGIGLPDTTQDRIEDAKRTLQLQIERYNPDLPDLSGVDDGKLDFLLNGTDGELNRLLYGADNPDITEDLTDRLSGNDVSFIQPLSGDDDEYAELGAFTLMEDGELALNPIN